MGRDDDVLAIATVAAAGFCRAGVRRREIWQGAMRANLAHCSVYRSIGDRGPKLCNGAPYSTKQIHWMGMYVWAYASGDMQQQLHGQGFMEGFVSMNGIDYTPARRSLLSPCQLARPPRESVAQVWSAKYPAGPK